MVKSATIMLTFLRLSEKQESKEEELARATIAKVLMVRPPKEKEKQTVPKGKTEPKAGKATEKERTPAKVTGGTGLAVKAKISGPGDSVRILRRASQQCPRK